MLPDIAFQEMLLRLLVVATLELAGEKI